MLIRHGLHLAYGCRKVGTKRHGKDNPVQDIMQRLGLPAEDDAMADPHQAAIALAMAMNQARLDMADRAGIKAEAQAYGTAKLEALRRKLMPLYAAIPRDVELFDLGLVTPEKPRLFVDILSFIEMKRDQTAFRFLQETRAGRITLAESADEKTIIDAVTHYVARRLVEREHALDTMLPAAPRSADMMDTPAPPAAPVAHVSTVHEAPIAEPTAQGASVRSQMPKAAPAFPMTADEAFRRWSRPSPDVEPGQPPEPAIEPAAQEAVPPGSVARMISATASRMSAEAHDTAASSAGKDDLSQTAVRMAASAKVPEATAAVSPVVKAAAGVTAGVAAAGGAAKYAATSIRRAEAGPAPFAAARSSGGWWFWSFLALLLGIGLGALALYLYAANLAR
jgi:hypothetical protein